jgi:hypothetical protein
MSELHYTTGPWVFDKDNPVRVLDNTGITIAATYGGMVGDIEQEANTKLIASVPNMFEYIKNRAKTGDTAAQEILNTIISE